MTGFWSWMEQLGTGEILVGLLVGGLVWLVTMVMLIRPERLGATLPRPDWSRRGRSTTQTLRGQLQQEHKKLEAHEDRLSTVQQSIKRTSMDQPAVMKELQEMKAQLEEALKLIRKSGS